MSRSRKLARWKPFWSISREGWRVKVMIPGRYRTTVRIIKAALTVFSLGMAFLTFASQWEAFIVAAGVYVVLSLFERTLFSYSAFYLHAIPEFEIRPDAWVGMGWGVAKPPDGSIEIPTVTMMFDDAEYAKKVHELLLHWTNGELDDEEGNLSLSAIQDGSHYVVFLYPSPTRRPAREMFTHARAALLRESPASALVELHGIFVLMKRCLIAIDSYFPTFRQRHRPGIPVLFELVEAPSSDGAWHAIPSLPPLVLHNVKFKDRIDLNRKDLEYDLPHAFEIDDADYLGPPDHQP